MSYKIHSILNTQYDGMQIQKPISNIFQFHIDSDTKIVDISKLITEISILSVRKRK